MTPEDVLRELEFLAPRSKTRIGDGAGSIRVEKALALRALGFVTIADGRRRGPGRWWPSTVTITAKGRAHLEEATS